MPLDLAEARRLGRLRMVNQRQQYKSCVGVEAAAGVPFPLGVDTAKLGELGPGIPLYFAFARRLQCLVFVCASLYGVIAWRYWTTRRLLLDEDGRSPWTNGHLRVGANMTQWMESWYAGSCGSGYAPLWAEDAFEGERATLNEVWKTSWFTAMSRGPWLGRREGLMEARAPMPDRACPTLDLKSNSTLFDGSYRQCGRHLGLPWFWHDTSKETSEASPLADPHAPCDKICGFAIFAVGNGSWALAAWGPRERLPDLLGNQDKLVIRELQELLGLDLVGNESDAGGDEGGTTTPAHVAPMPPAPQCELTKADDDSEDWWKDWWKTLKKWIWGADSLPKPELNETLEALLPVLAYSEAHGGRYPDNVTWTLPDLAVGLAPLRVDHDDEQSKAASPYSDCDAKNSGIPAIQCLDVALPCEGCMDSMILQTLQDFGWQGDTHAVPADVDVLLVSLVCICILCLAPPMIVYRIRQKAKTANHRTAKASSYTVHVQGLPWYLDDSNEEELSKYLQDTLDFRYPLHWHSFPERGAHHIVKVTFVFRLSTLISLLSREKRSREMSARMKVVVADLQMDVQELQTTRNNGGPDRSCWWKLRLELRILKARHDVKKAIRWEQWYKNDREKCIEKLGQEKRKLQVTGAMVTFEHAFAAQRCVDAFRRGLCGRRGARRPTLFQGKVLRICFAPEPSDVIWKNFGEPEWKVILLRALAAVMLLAVMLVMCCVIYMLTRIKKMAALRGADDFTWTLIFRSMGPAIVWTDILLREVVAKGVELEVPRSAAHAAVSAMWKHTACGIFNSCLACLFVHAEQDEKARTCEVNWYMSGNLLDNAVSICMTNMVMTPFLLLFSPWGNNPLKSRLALYFLDPKRTLKTQREVTELHSGVEYRLAYRYASSIKTLFLTMMYAPLAPLVVLAGFVSLQLQYWADKVCLLRTAERPPWQDYSLGAHASYAIPLVMLPIPLLTVFLLRGTAFANLVNWVHPCLSLWGEDGNYLQRIGIQLYVLSPVIAILIAVSIYGGVKSLIGALNFICTVLRVLLIIILFSLRMFVYCVTCGRCGKRPPSYQRMTQFLREQEDLGPSMSYYCAQHFLPMKYHMTNPVYEVLPQEVNPEIIEEPRRDAYADASFNTRVRTIGGVAANTSHRMSFRSALEELVQGHLNTGEQGREGESDAESDGESTMEMIARISARLRPSRTSTATSVQPLRSSAVASSDGGVQMAVLGSET